MVPSSLDVDVLNVFFACTSTKIVFCSSFNIKEAIKELWTSNTVEKRGDATRASYFRWLWMLTFFVYSWLDNLRIVFRRWGWKELSIKKTNLMVGEINGPWYSTRKKWNLTTPYIVERQEILILKYDVRRANQIVRCRSSLSKVTARLRHWSDRYSQ